MASHTHLRPSRSVRRRLSVGIGAAFAALSLAGVWAYGTTLSDAAPSGPRQEIRTGQSGLPLPRFVSLKSDRVNVRSGPSRDHRVDWTFMRAGLPVEIVAEYDNWRRIRDSDGSEGWIFHSLLSGRRTGVVAPWSQENTVPLKQSGSPGAGTLALLQPGVLVDLKTCGGEWCRVAVGDVSGWLRQQDLWGVYPREIIE